MFAIIGFVVVLIMGLLLVVTGAVMWYEMLALTGNWFGDLGVCYVVALVGILLLASAIHNAPFHIVLTGA